ncbi:hypothetical protein ACFSHT_20705 [Paraburkholderia silviterrae]|uniref:Uncharacterized protein n=1 Tax=Paraburkholderia silviterrae TaxID=2528715 RepID=A0A4R5M4G1_9BURK|nr:hypothetical protein [Paraburkholderia silviterrae]TDG20705.1 hypothetical protein EYW47_24490 [Paraburkholderia silviterrae]
MLAFLGVDGNLCDDASRTLAMERLAALLEDETQTERLFCTLRSAGPSLDEGDARNDNFKPLQRFHAYRHSDRELLDNPATVGKAMGAQDTQSRRTGMLEGSGGAYLEGRLQPASGGMVQAHAPRTLVEESGLLSCSDDAREARIPDVLLRWQKFALEVDHVLRAHQSLWGRLSAFFHRSNLSSRWEQTEPDWLDLYLQEGRRRWLLQIHFGGDSHVVVVIVSGKPGKPLQVPANDPREFSMRLIDAFDGDVNPARFALTSVEQAIEASTRASHH